MFESFIGVNFWTALFVLLNTLAVFFVAKKFLFVPVKNMIDSRQKEIDAMYEEAGAAKEEAKALQSEYQEKLAVAQQTSDRMVKEAVARGQNRQEEIISQANAEARAILDKAAADIAQEKKKAINDAKNEISAMAMAIAEKVVGRELNDVDQTKLVDEFIEELGD
ncbi:MAG: F0F1 ATP synthase subunit B [Lachnospiraceae bacterium]|nr:F0F1 ATP synthase subunit B [Lachnospiraceae bacterium]